MSRSRLTISCPARLHLGLFSMNSDMPRVNGGIGFAIDAPNVQIEAEASDEIHIQDERKAGMDAAAIERLFGTLQRAANPHGLEKQVSLRISGDADAHYGFGTGTSIALASLEALFLLNDHQTTKDELIHLSGRGGTSGIGIHTYFDGGMVVDLGRRSDGRKPQPTSQAGTGFELPLLLGRSELPLWELGVCIPSHIDPLSSDAEKTFFASTCPIPEADVYRTTYLGLTTIFAAVRDGDRGVFIEGLRIMQEYMWKKAEWDCHGQELRNIERELYAHGASVVGMSSLGPSLFFLAKNVSAMVAELRNVMPKCCFFNSLASNQGRVVTWSN